jgi:hypothetical protein
LRILFVLVLKDFRRDFKSPWSILLFASLPVLMTGLIALAFGGRSGSAPAPVVRVAVLDEDQDVVGALLSFLATQTDASRQVELRYVENREEGLSLLERNDASALVVLPPGLTDKVVAGEPTAFEFYENPNEQILPKVVRQQISLLADGLSAVTEVLRERLVDVRRMIRAEALPSDLAVAFTSWQIIREVRHYEPYVLPPLIDFETVDAAEYQLQAEIAPEDEPKP